MATTVPASEFTRNFGRYRMCAQQEAIAVSSHGEITDYFVGPAEYEELWRCCDGRRSFATADLAAGESRGHSGVPHGSAARSSEWDA